MEKDSYDFEKNNNIDDEDELGDSKKSSKKSKNTEDSLSHSAKFFSKLSKDEESNNTKNIDDFENSESEDEQEQDSAPIDGLTESEVHEAIQIIIDEREQAVTDELVNVEDGSVGEFEAVADALFLESLRRQSIGDDEITPESIDQVFEETLEDLEIESDLSVDQVDDVIDSTQSNLLESEDLPSSPVVPPIPPRPPISPPTSPTPPIPPVPPTPPTSPNNNLPPPQNPNNQNINQQQNSAPNRQNRNIVPLPIPVPVEAGAAALAGAIAGYIIGRRKSGSLESKEKNVISQTKKLEHQIQQIQTIIYTKEKRIRQEARDSVKKSSKSVKPFVIAERRKKRVEVREELKKRQEIVNNPKVEKIGEFSLPALKVFRERRLLDGTENHPNRKPVEIMTVPELLEKTGHIKFDGWRIDELYKAHRITEKVLREVTKQYLRGGPYKQTLAREVSPDPSIIAEKQKKVESVHESKKEHNKHYQEEYEPKNIKSDAVSYEKKDQIQKTKRQNQQPKRNSKLPLPWIAVATAIATVLALTLIYIL